MLVTTVMVFECWMARLIRAKESTVFNCARVLAFVVVLTTSMIWIMPIYLNAFETTFHTLFRLWALGLANVWSCTVAVIFMIESQRAHSLADPACFPTEHYLLDVDLKSVPQLEKVTTDDLLVIWICRKGLFHFCQNKVLPLSEQSSHVVCEILNILIVHIKWVLIRLTYELFNDIMK